MKRSSQHRVQTPQKGLSASGRSPGVRTTQSPSQKVLAHTQHGGTRDAWSAPHGRRRLRKVHAIEESAPGRSAGGAADPSGHHAALDQEQDNPARHTESP
jgi:hypothetical protein